MIKRKGIEFSYSLRASPPIWGSETSLARTRERAAKPRAPHVVLEAKNATIDFDKNLLQCEEGGRQRE